jgi:hypothetical protein
MAEDKKSGNADLYKNDQKDLKAVEQHAHTNITFRVVKRFEAETRYYTTLKEYLVMEREIESWEIMILESREAAHMSGFRDL